MHILSNIKDFLYDKNDFIAYYDNFIYIYNFNKIDTLTSEEIVIIFDYKKIIIKGQYLKVIKCLKNELEITGILESVNIYE